MQNSDYLPYARQHIDASDIDGVSEVLKSQFITRGPKVEEFEKTIANYCEVKYAIAFNSASTALNAAYHVTGITPGDRIYTTPNSFVATIAGGVMEGATPVFLDIDLHSGNFDINQLEINMNRPATRGKEIIVPVHFSGVAIDLDKIQNMIKNPETLVIEDAAHALGSFYPGGEKVGCCKYSDMTIFSFHPAKTITTGEGGMVTTNREDYYLKLLRYRDSGIIRSSQNLTKKLYPGYYEVTELSSNYHFTEIQASLGLTQFAKLKQFGKKRHQLMLHYQEKLKELSGVRLLSPNIQESNVYHLCIILVEFDKFKKSRMEVMSQLHEIGIGTQLHYYPLYKHPFFTKKNRDISQYFPNMETYTSQALTLPLYYDLEVADVDRIIEGLKNVLGAT